MSSDHRNDFARIKRAAELEFRAAAQAAIDAGLDDDDLHILIAEAHRIAREAAAESMWEEEEG